MANQVTFSGYILEFLDNFINPDGTQTWLYTMAKGSDFPPSGNDFTLVFTLCKDTKIVGATAGPGEDIGATFDDTNHTVTYTWNGKGEPINKQFSIIVDKPYDVGAVDVTLNGDSPSPDEQITGPACTAAPTPPKGIDFRMLKDLELYEE